MDMFYATGSGSQMTELLVRLRGVEAQLTVLAASNVKQEELAQSLLQGQSRLEFLLSQIGGVRGGNAGPGVSDFNSRIIDICDSPSANRVGGMVLEGSEAGASQSASDRGGSDHIVDGIASMVLEPGRRGSSFGSNVSLRSFGGDTQAPDIEAQTPPHAPRAGGAAGTGPEAEREDTDDVGKKSGTNSMETVDTLRADVHQNWAEQHHPSLDQLRHAFNESKKKKPKTPFQNALESRCYEFVMCALILSNTVFIGAQVQHASSFVSTPSYQEPVAFTVLDLIYFVLFVVDIALRVAAYRVSFFIVKGGWQWNVFDFGVVLLMSFEQLDRHVITADFPFKSVSTLCLVRAVRAPTSSMGSLARTRLQ
mmetsp:Transcript_107914/g.344463  ORF Transcript_107914/g.344463 Transcript_107914/m.344463 type:complete len:366 (-) Transcript_107914:119-1216(-)